MSAGWLVMLLKSGLRHYFVLDTNASMSTARRRDTAVAKGAAQAGAKQD